jgi:hypothetical protein
MIHESCQNNRKRDEDPTLHVERALVRVCHVHTSVRVSVSVCAFTKYYAYVVWRSRYVGQEAGITNK